MVYCLISDLFKHRPSCGLVNNIIPQYQLIKFVFTVYFNNRVNHIRKKMVVAQAFMNSDQSTMLKSLKDVLRYI